MNPRTRAGVGKEMRRLMATVLLVAVAASLPFLSSFLEDSTPASTPCRTDPFEKAVEIIKKYETLHQPRHWPLVGYGHKILPGEKYSRSRPMSESEADALLRKDLLKNCAVFRSFGKDSLILGVLAYNIGCGTVKRSSVAEKLRNGNRDVRSNYISYCRYKGKEHARIKQRRIEEFNNLFDAVLQETDSITGTIAFLTNNPKKTLSCIYQSRSSHS